ncbi:hypothetical protein EFT87_10620 [Schleiferilactobacillus harbinensis]|uniref:hypothetical protein n=1 Tax=Schleiferilactobacillus harbinensis TaxID=304207 RepID=UPI0021A86975|nr:hypothetical protein [Schleiferilactobacillus harbinensis]MCT2909108.1 hypothetical protein [Schleiferilactobacillus harbinensis]
MNANCNHLKPLARDPERLTIMGITMPNKAVYDELVFAITNQMYSGYVPTVTDVQHLLKHYGELPSAQESLKW